MEGKGIMKETYETLGAVVNTLNQISVSGMGNLRKLSGCIGVLEDLMQKLKEQETGAVTEG